MAQQQQQQYTMPGSAGSGDVVLRTSQAWAAQTAELQQLTTDLTAAHNRLRDAGRLPLHSACCFWCIM